MTQDEFIVVMSTTDSAEEAKSLARGAVEKKLAACVQMTTVNSTYWWDGAIEDADEFLLLFKTPTDRVAELRKHLLAVHSYETPEIIEIPIVGGGQGYLDWMISSTRA